MTGFESEGEVREPSFKCPASSSSHLHGVIIKGMSGIKKWILAGAAVVALGVGGTAIAGVAGSDDNGGTGDDGAGKPITGPALDKASAIALDHAGGGRVTGTELQDEEGYYEIEVTKTDGSQVDVHLDSHFNVLNARGDGGSDGED
jgi:hypothetical protein